MKTIGPATRTARINGLDQLDAGADPLVLAAVRLEATGATAPGAITAPALVARLRDRLAADPDALAEFDASLACAGWHDDPSFQGFAVRLVAIEAFDVGPGFPRLIRSALPAGIEDADYTIALPRPARTIVRGNR